MAANAIRAGADLETAKEILDTITTEQSVEILKRKGYLEATMKEISDRVEFYLNKRAGEQLEVGTILFSNVYGKLAETSKVPELARKIMKQAEKKKHTIQCADKEQKPNQQKNEEKKL